MLIDPIVSYLIHSLTSAQGLHNAYAQPRLTFKNTSIQTRGNDKVLIIKKIFEILEVACSILFFYCNDFYSSMIKRDGTCPPYHVKNNYLF